MEPFFLLTALSPLALYFGFLAYLNSRPAPVVLSGAADRLALFAAIAGFVFIGPLQLIAPIEALVDKGGFAWVMLFLLYFLLVLFFTLNHRPRLMIYNVSTASAVETLAEALKKFDPDSTASGPAAYSPRAEFGVLIEMNPRLNHAVLTLVGRKPNPVEWRLFENSLTESFVLLPNGGRRVWKVFALFAFALAAGIVWLAVRYPDEIAGGFQFFLHP